ncbi:hypothetical protein BT63DRAFT_430128 [Microthyrium microscopicum]|uniref:Nucleotide-diphospho-sugar transferase n=1 Tax=Microthyrium microscopicum TaxID=703497 RepID=A0A6A6TWM8_9PEZI|nr:hypothetical protein BT63DRAFT_430128 [Microthyrium microscopicum]
MFPRFRLRMLVVALVAILTLGFTMQELSTTYDLRVDTTIPKTYFTNVGSRLQKELDLLRAKPAPKVASHSTRSFKAGVPKPAGESYTKTIVVGAKSADDTSWLDIDVPSNIEKAIYAVDDPNAVLHPPANKGREAMVYLTYIIDHYTNLSDVTLFMHSHRWAWHNNDLLDNDSAALATYLLPQRVLREGYVNLRCQWYPGCPTWLDTAVNEAEKPEGALIAKAWSSLFPTEPLPSHLASTCCAQFALSRARITAIPLAEYERLRTWLLNTRLEDGLSGRVFEYVWHYLWTGQAILCADQHTCFCETYGLCFSNESSFQAWFEKRFYLRRDEWQLVGWDRERGAGKKVDERQYDEVREKVNGAWMVLADWRDRALEDGRDGLVRARVGQRQVDAGDGDGKGRLEKWKSAKG